MYDIIFVCVPSCCIVLIRRKVVESITLLSFVNPIKSFPFLSLLPSTPLLKCIQTKKTTRY